MNQSNYVWNRGIFIFKYSTIKLVKKYIPNHDDVINDMKKVFDIKTGQD